MLVGNNMNITELRKYVREWNDKFPIDRWWRKKHGIPFGSPRHLDQSLMDMRFEFEEDQFYKKIEIVTYNEEFGKKDNYTPGANDWLRKQANPAKMNKIEIDSAFDQLLEGVGQLGDMLKSKVDENGKKTITV